MVSGIVLAAGLSERMGTPKPFLKSNGRTFVEHIIDNLRGLNANPIILVLNHLHKPHLDSPDLQGVSVCFNPNPRLGQFSSLKIGIEKLNHDIDAFFMCLVDHPFVKLSTYRKMVELSKGEEPFIMIPSYHKAGGHPVLFSGDFREIIAQAPSSWNGKTIKREYSNAVIYIDVDDKGVVTDIDTPEEFRAASAREHREKK